MRRVTAGTTAITTVAIIAAFVMGQPPDRPGERGPGGRGGPPPHPVLEALDADGDHDISAQEIENAAAALKKLDRNGDGKLMHDELHPFGPGGPRRGGPRGPDDGERGGRRGRRGPEGGQGGARDATAFIERIRNFDKNNDGKISKDELPDRMQRILDRHDENEDGVLEETELEQMAAHIAQARGSGRGDRRPGARRGPEGRPGGREGRRGPGRFRGPPSPEQFVERAMTFDADKDGKLSRDELATMAEEFVRRGPPGRGREGRRGPGGRRGRPDGGGDERPQRPARPEPE